MPMMKMPQPKNSDMKLISYVGHGTTFYFKLILPVGVQAVVEDPLLPVDALSGSISQIKTAS